MAKLFSSSKKGMSADKVINTVVGVVVLTSIAGALYTTFATAVNDSSFTAIPLVGTFGTNGLLGLLFGVLIFYGVWAYLRMKKR